MTEASLERGREFIYATARVLEQRLFATLFEGAPAMGVSMRCARTATTTAASDTASSLMRARRPASRSTSGSRSTRSPPPVRAPTTSCCGVRLAGDARCPRPIMLPSIRGYPQAKHWRETAEFLPGLFGTIGAMAALHALGNQPARTAGVSTALGRHAGGAAVLSRCRPRVEEQHQPRRRDGSPQRGSSVRTRRSVGRSRRSLWSHQTGS
jgi:hypothetical protein